MCYVGKVRLYAQEMALEDAVERSIRECVEDDVLADFLRNNRAEAKSMSIFEYDEELHMRQEREAAKQDGWEEGLEEGRREAISRMLKKLSKEEILELGYSADEIQQVMKK